MNDPRTRTRAAQVVRLPAAIVALFAMLLTSVVGVTSSPVSAAELTRVIVTARGSLADAAQAVAETGGTVVEAIMPFGMSVAEVPAGLVDDLERDPRTADVSPDTVMRVSSTETIPASDELLSAVETVNAPAGDAGAGVGVVLVDTGISDPSNPHPDLDDRLAAAIDFTDEQDGVDHHGHGTFLAGLVAGSGAASDGAYRGIAPGAHLVSVKVAPGSGETTLSRVLQGLVAADRARDLYDAPVVLLALAGPTGDNPDPVMTAVEMLWSRGSIVVTPSGNDGSEDVASPGADPYVITAGSVDDKGTVDSGDDERSTFSSYGTPWGYEKPELVAPGRSKVGLRMADSTIDDQNSPDTETEHYMRGSGTSMSAAVTAGAAAVVVATNPGVTPDEVKGRLVGTATDLASEGTGAGLIDVSAAADDAADGLIGNEDLEALPTPDPDGDGPGLWTAPVPDPPTPPVGGRPDGAQRPESPGPGAGASPLDDHGFGGWIWTNTGWIWTGWKWTGWKWTGWKWTQEYWAGWKWTGWKWTAEPEGWKWTGWKWTDGEWQGWKWTAEPNGWKWTGEPNGWKWTGDPTGWKWTEDSWAGWKWSGWKWSGWKWSTESWE